MGCDIHIHTEKRVIRADGSYIWVNTDNFQFNEYNVLYPEYEPEDDYLVKYIYNGRNYHLFGILAGVRTSSPFQISPQKGLPEDVTDLTAKRFNPDNFHSATWFTLKELINYYHRMKKNSNIIWKAGSTYDYDEPFYLGDFKYFLKCVKRKALEDLDKYKLYPKDYILDNRGEDYRIIIWFDS